jgi:pyruvate,orthophosphate dikinase
MVSFFHIAGLHSARVGNGEGAVAHPTVAGSAYVSCSPFRVPIARLAAAQAALGKEIASQA